jgi:hypothetical protein
MQSQEIDPAGYHLAALVIAIPPETVFSLSQRTAVDDANQLPLEIIDLSLMSV